MTAHVCFSHSICTSKAAWESWRLCLNVCWDAAREAGIQFCSAKDIHKRNALWAADNNHQMGQRQVS